MEMVRKKIQILQQQLDEAEDRELAVQKEYDTERGLREVVRNDSILFPPNSRVFHSQLSCSLVFVDEWHDSTRRPRGRGLPAAIKRIHDAVRRVLQLRRVAHCQIHRFSLFFNSRSVD